MSHLRPPAGRAPPILIWLIRLLALGAGGVSAFLLVLSFADRVPAGCGGDSGCGQVLASAWSTVGRVPVAALAVAVYATAALATIWLSPAAPPRRQRVAWVVLVAAGVAAAGAAGWFAYVQYVRLGEVCPWCMGVHAAGAAMLLAVLAALWCSRGGEWVPPKSRLAAAAGVAVAGVAGLAAVQLLVPPPVPPPLPPRVVAMKLPRGPRELVLNDVPTLGPRDAPHVVALLADYTCPHCRNVHASLMATAARYPRDLCVVVGAVPINASCNKYIFISGTPPARHATACELAKLSLAVYRASPAAFGEFDRWLFEPPVPPDPDAARRRAAELVGADALARAEADPWVADRLRQNTELYAAAYGSDRPGRLPVLILPDRVVLDIPDDPDWVTGYLERNVGLGRAP